MEYVADDRVAVRARLDELRLEAEMVLDINVASGDWLDAHGRRAGMGRGAGEGDYNYRVRIKVAVA